MFVTLTENKTPSTAHTVPYSASTQERVTTKALSCVTVNMDTLNQILQNHQGTTNLIQPHIMRQPHITPQHIIHQHLIIPHMHIMHQHRIILLHPIIHPRPIMPLLIILSLTIPRLLHTILQHPLTTLQLLHLTILQHLMPHLPIHQSHTTMPHLSTFSACLSLYVFIYIHSEIVTFNITVLMFLAIYYYVKCTNYGGFSMGLF